MRQKSPWYRWPESREKGRVAWFVILRRLIFWPALLLGKCITFLAILGAFGWREAKRDLDR